MKNLKKILAVLLALALLSVGFVSPVSAAPREKAASFSARETLEHNFYRFVDQLINTLGKVLNLFIPGLNWTDRIPKLSDYAFDGAFMGESIFDREVIPEAKWSMGFADASLLEGLDLGSGAYYLAGSLEVFKGRTPTGILDDQTVNVYALSDGVSGTVVHVVLDGYGFARGDVLEIRNRLRAFARENDIIAINVSALHQHSCIDTLGLSAPLLPALAKNPLGTLTTKNTASLSGKNETFMNNLFNVVTRSVAAAVENMTEGSLYYGSADIDDFIYDKRDPITYDSEMHRLRFIPDDESRNEIWVCEAGIHCVGFGAAADVLSADFPYYLKQYIKTQTGADLVFVEGAELALTAEYKTLTYDTADPTAKLKAMGKALGDRLLSIKNEEPLDPVLNIKIEEIRINADNQILILAVREGLTNNIAATDKGKYVLITELGYMELGNKIGILLAPGEMAPEILYGGVISPENTWTGRRWDYPALATLTGTGKLLCFGLTNDQIGYVIADNDIRSYLTENEEITASSTTAASTIARSFISLLEGIKG